METPASQSPPAQIALSPSAELLRHRIRYPFAFATWSLLKLPSAWFTGVRLVSVDTQRCVASVPYGWRSQNPFRSTYFAAQAMAAEMSTGALGMLALEDAGVPFSILIVDMQASFGKKATSTATFVCEEGAVVFDAVREAKATGESRTFTLHSIGTLADGSEVSRFSFTWSVKPRRARG